MYEGSMKTRLHEASVVPCLELDILFLDYLNAQGNVFDLCMFVRAYMCVSQNPIIYQPCILLYAMANPFRGLLAAEK